MAFVCECALFKLDECLNEVIFVSRLAPTFSDALRRAQNAPRGSKFDLSPSFWIYPHSENQHAKPHSVFWSNFDVIFFQKETFTPPLISPYKNNFFVEKKNCKKIIFDGKIFFESDSSRPTKFALFRNDGLPKKVGDCGRWNVRENVSTHRILQRRIPRSLRAYRLRKLRRRHRGRPATGKRFTGFGLWALIPPSRQEEQPTQLIGLWPKTQKKTLNLTHATSK